MDSTFKRVAHNASSAETTPEYRIGRVTKELDLGQYTLKHYERAGLIEPAKSEAGFRFYTRQDFGKIITIRSLRRLGFSVEEVGDLLACDAPGALAAMEDKLAENDRLITELREANHLLHRHISSLRNNLARPSQGTFDPEAAGLVFVSHFRGDEWPAAASWWIRARGEASTSDRCWACESSEAQLRGRGSTAAGGGLSPWATSPTYVPRWRRSVRRVGRASSMSRPVPRCC